MSVFTSCLCVTGLEPTLAVHFSVLTVATEWQTTSEYECCHYFTMSLWECFSETVILHNKKNCQFIKW